MLPAAAVRAAQLLACVVHHLSRSGVRSTLSHRAEEQLTLRQASPAAGRRAQDRGAAAAENHSLGVREHRGAAKQQAARQGRSSDCQPLLCYRAASLPASTGARQLKTHMLKHPWHLTSCVHGGQGGGSVKRWSQASPSPSRPSLAVQGHK
jgi:hypothetical protein